MSPLSPAGGGVLWPSEARPPLPGAGGGHECDTENSLTLPGQDTGECITPTPNLQQHYVMPPPTGEAPGSTYTHGQEDVISEAPPTTNCQGEAPGAMDTHKQEDESAVSEAPPTTRNHHRRPRLCTQSSMESQTSLPEDMSEIELLTGDLHDPVVSSRGPRKV